MRHKKIEKLNLLITRHAANRIIERWGIPVNEARKYIERAILEGFVFLEKKSNVIVIFWNGWKIVLGSKNERDFAIITIANDGYYYKDGRLSEIALKIKEVSWID